MEDEEEIEEEPWYKGPIRIIIGLFLLMLILLMAVPYYGVKVDPEPSGVPKIDEVIKSDIKITNMSHRITKIEDYRLFVEPSNPIIKDVANKVVSLGCNSNNVCHAKALYYFVRDNLDYISDPLGREYIENPVEILVIGGGDCEGGAILLASLNEAVGIDAEMVFIPGHAFVRIKLKEAVKRYKRDDWVYLDWTCKNCDFGEIPYQNWKKEMSFLDV